MRLIDVICVAAGMMAVTLSSSAPAAASAPPLEYSVDGVTWQSTPPPLFPQSLRPVPGTQHTATTYVRSTHAEPANLAVFLDQATSASDTLLQAVTVRGANAHEYALADVDRCEPLQSGRILPGESVPVTVTMSIAPSLSDAQRTSLQFELATVISDAAIPPSPAGCGTSVPDDALALTGAEAAEAAPFIAGGAVAIVAGILLAARNRRKDVA